MVWAGLGEKRLIFFSSQLVNYVINPLVLWPHAVNLHVCVYIYIYIYIYTHIPVYMHPKQFAVYIYTHTYLYTCIQNNTCTICLTLSHPEALLWQVKSSGDLDRVKYNKVSTFGRSRRERVKEERWSDRAQLILSHPEALLWWVK